MTYTPSTMPGPGDPETWGAPTGHPHDPRTIDPHEPDAPWGTHDEYDDDEDAAAWLSRDQGATPCSRYGSTAADCVPVAVAVARIIAHEQGVPLTGQALDDTMALVVNDSPDPALTLVRYGIEHGYDPSDYLDDDTLDAADGGHEGLRPRAAAPVPRRTTRLTREGPR